MISGAGDDVEIHLTRPPLYLAMLDHPQIYWEPYDRPDIWRWFAPYELLDLGVTISERPMGFYADRADSPDPSGLAALVLLARRRP